MLSVWTWEQGCLGLQVTHKARCMVITQERPAIVTGMNGFLSSKVGYEEYLRAPLWRLRLRNSRLEILNEGSDTTCWVQPSLGAGWGLFNSVLRNSLPSSLHTCYTCVLGQAGVNPYSSCQTASVFEPSLPEDPSCCAAQWLEKRFWVPQNPSLPIESLCDSGQLTQFFWVSNSHL